MPDRPLTLSVMEALEQIREGSALSDFRDELLALCHHVVAKGKGGKIVLELTVEPNGPKNVFITDRVKATLPEVKNNRTGFYLYEGGLTRTDPAQLSFQQALDDHATKKEV